MSTELRDSNRSELPTSTGNGVEPVSEFRIDERLTAIERELGTQGREAKKTRQAYGLFAVMAVLIAIVNLVVLSIKLDNKDSGRDLSVRSRRRAGSACTTRAHQRDNAEGVHGHAPALGGGGGPRGL